MEYRINKTISTCGLPKMKEYRKKQKKNTTKYRHQPIKN